jgi:hypothetical protein
MKLKKPFLVFVRRQTSLARLAKAAAKRLVSEPSSELGLGQYQSVSSADDLNIGGARLAQLAFNATALNH